MADDELEISLVDVRSRGYRFLTQQLREAVSKTMTEETTDTPTDKSTLFEEGRLIQAKLDNIDFGDETYRFRAALRTGPLQASLDASGLQIPVVLKARPRGRNSKYQIISGFRRCTAAREIGWTHITAIVRSGISDEEAFRASVLENTERKTYSDIDRAYVIRAYKARGIGSTDVAALMGLSKRQANNIQSLLELPEVVQDAIDDNEQYFSATHGLTLKKLSSTYPQLEYEGWVKLVNEKELSVAQLKRQVNAEYRPEAQSGFQTLFNVTGTNLDEGEVRFMPVKLKLSELADDEKAALKAELKALLKKL
jgi:ParB/RepB/Spo0J family partition protein